ncbi:hypothetical protein [Rhizobium leguminosarum]|uniref:hypothetical protein n=1 Tax=Rhizobium leguminosarum TaxID=384 RepID=UPI001441F6A0|nr:hypothetical protein [Rhizobium leguminosarum]MBY5868851.1 hypothetical protein [Rhizobium leguminosarum]NKM06278.1 hypothetical protein [Rhizobium leguminosarum bv. viciae]
MISVTLHTGQNVEIDGYRVQRIRRATAAENPLGKKSKTLLTRIDWDDLYYVMDDRDELAARIAQELPTFDTLNTPALGPLWFNAKISIGPRHLSQGYRRDGVRSALSIGSLGRLQLVANTPQEVAAVIRKNGGRVLPILDDAKYSDLVAGLHLSTIPIADWAAGY